MSEKEKKGVFGSLFGGTMKNCCNMEIVEEPELVCT